MSLLKLVTATLAASAAVVGIIGAQATAAPRGSVPAPSSTTVAYHTVEVHGIKVFYREAGNPNAPTILLLHGFPTSSHMYRDLIPLLADQYHVVAPDLPGFGFSDAPDRSKYSYTFDNLANTIDAFTEVIELHRYAIQVFDYGAPVGWRLAVAHPERITAIVTQNGNAYEEGLSSAWNPIQKYWQDPASRTGVHFGNS
jgi:pimeloyl-ACP methyl ester carboxylesterase